MSTAPVEPILRLNDAELEWKRFERFSLDLVRALPEVADAHLYGERGDLQDGIDIHADLLDGRVRSIQCRRVQKFGKPNVDATIAKTTYVADEHWIWATCSLTAPARKAIRAAGSKWTAWDLEQISSAVRGLPREVGRWLVEDHLGQVERRRVLGPDSDLTLAPAQAWFAAQDEQGTLRRTTHPLYGRHDALNELRTAFSDDTITVVILTGRSGVGKTRMVRALAECSADRRILIARPGVETGPHFADELPMADFDIVVDDADQRTDLEGLLACAFSRADDLGTIVLTAQPQHVARLRTCLSRLGLPSAALEIVGPLDSLSAEAGQRLAEHVLRPELRDGAAELARQTRDAPASLVLAADLVNRGEIEGGALLANDEFRLEVLTRFGQNRVDTIPDVDVAKIADRLLPLWAAVEPVSSDAQALCEWLAAQANCTLEELERTTEALRAADLLVGPRTKTVLAPRVFADHLLHQLCLKPDGTPTNRPLELLSTSPVPVVGRALRRFSELDWRLSGGGHPTFLKPTLSHLEQVLIKADAWDRSQLLEALTPSAAFVPEWSTRVARELLDAPATARSFLPGFQFTDLDVTEALAQLLSGVGIRVEYLGNAVRLLWELAGRRATPKLGGVDPLSLAQRLGSYQLPLMYAQTLLATTESLTEKPGSEHSVPDPIELLARLVVREGTTTEMASPHALRAGSYQVDAIGTAELRGELLTLLATMAVDGQSLRRRYRAAGLLGNMMREPTGYFGQGVEQSALRQWRAEQLSLVKAASAVLEATEEPVIRNVLRERLEWHARHSHLHGVKASCLRVLRDNPRCLDEEVLGILVHSHRGSTAEAIVKHTKKIAKRLLESATTPKSLLDRVDALGQTVAAADPARGVDWTALFYSLPIDPQWAFEASEILLGSPERPSAAGNGAFLALASPGPTDEGAARLRRMTTSSDLSFRRQAADQVARLGWELGKDAELRQAALALASDPDELVVRNVLLGALRASDSSATTSREIVLTVRDFSSATLADEACMVATEAAGWSREDRSRLLERLVRCPSVPYWYDIFLVRSGQEAPEVVLDHLLRRIEYEHEDPAYQALPIGGLSQTFYPPLAGASQKSGLLKIVARLADSSDGQSSLALEEVFWTVSGAATEEQRLSHESSTTEASMPTASSASLEVLGEGLLSQNERLRDASRRLVASAPGEEWTTHVDWIELQLEAAPAGDDYQQLRSAFIASITSGSRMGISGQPFPRDIQIESIARERAESAPPTSRTEAFWEKVAEMTAATNRRNRDGG